MSSERTAPEDNARATPPGVVWAVACADRSFRHPGLKPEVVQEDAEFDAMAVDVLIERLDREDCGPHQAVKCELMPVFEWPEDAEPLTADEVAEQVEMAEECYSSSCREDRERLRALTEAARVTIAGEHTSVTIRERLRAALGGKKENGDV